ncbi:MAG TPA: polysaccharide biosynthesis tyrosine autokinase [Candidatus Alectryocaccobium stercorigallinarum]|nr:polysaccharide biosynthesis tyrosine autokinase [Candidatus Alectryocaccobium stercorigallinarum]
MNKISLKLKPREYQITEAYKTLRTNLQFCGEEKKVIALTSCTPNEGKSTVSFNLALSLAEAGKKTLLIDADMRKSVLVGETKPSQQNLQGLAHYLSGQSVLQDVIYMTDVPNLCIVYSGPFPPNPAELLNGNKFNSMLQALRKVYDYVIVDTPPIGSVIDGAIIAEKCDGSILVIESGVISYRFAQEVKDQLDRSGCPLLGAVLNKVDMSNSGYGKYYGKYYGDYGNRNKGGAK